MDQKIHSPEQIRSLLATAKELGYGDTVIERLTVILRYSEYPESITETCASFSISRTTLSNWLERFDPSDLSSLEDRYGEGRAKESHALAVVVEHIRRIRTETPLLGKERIAEILKEQHGIDVSASTVGRIIDRECLYFANTPFHQKKRIEHGSRRSSARAECSKESLIGASRNTQSNLDLKTEGGRKRTLLWRSIVTMSVLGNIIFLGFLLATAIVESWSHRQTPAMQAQSVEEQVTEPMHAAPSVYSKP